MIDRSGWPIGRVLNMKSKGDFVSHMLVEELVGKRLQLLQNFREGLDLFGLVGMIKENPSLWEPLFVTKEPVTVRVTCTSYDVSMYKKCEHHT